MATLNFYKGESLNIIFTAYDNGTPPKLMDISGYSRTVEVFTPYSTKILPQVSNVSNNAFQINLTSEQTKGLNTGSFNIVVKLTKGTEVKIGKSIPCKILDPYIGCGPEGLYVDNGQAKVDMKIDTASINFDLFFGTANITIEGEDASNFIRKSELSKSLGDAENVAPSEKAVFDIANKKVDVEIVSNLFSDTAWTDGKYISSSGTEGVLAAASYSGYINIDPLKSYYLVFDNPSGEVYPIWGCVYNSDKQVITGGFRTAINANTAVIKFLATAAFVRLNVATANIAGAYLLTENDYAIYIRTKALDASKLINVNAVFSEVDGINKSENILEQGLNITVGGYLGSNGQIIPNPNFGYSGKLAVKPNTKYYTNLNTSYAVFCIFRDADDNVIGSWGNGSSTEIRDFITPDKAASLQVTIGTSANDSHLYSDRFIKDTTLNGFYINSTEAVDAYTKAEVDSKLEGKADADNVFVKTDKIPIVNLDTSLAVQAGNLALGAEIKQGGYWRDDMVWSASANFSSLVFPVNAGTEYIFNNAYGSNNGLWVDRKGLFISPVGGAGTNTETYTSLSPVNAVSVILTCENSKIETKYFKATKYVDAESTNKLVVPGIITLEPIPIKYAFDLSMRNDNTFVGAMNTIIDAFYAANPRIRIAMATHFTKDGRNSGQNGSIKNIVDTQLKIAEYWGIPCLDLSVKCGWVKKNGINTIQPFFNDQLHPATDATGQSSILIKNFFVEFLRPIFGADWAGKKVAIIGTSITAGHGSSESWAKHIDAAVLEHGGIPTNYAVSGRCARRTKVDGTVIDNSFMNLSDPRNYTVVADKIANGDFDLVILDHGINDQQYDNTDFITQY